MDCTVITSSANMPLFSLPPYCPLSIWPPFIHPLHLSCHTAPKDQLGGGRRELRAGSDGCGGCPLVKPGEEGMARTGVGRGGGRPLVKPRYESEIAWGESSYRKGVYSCMMVTWVGLWKT